MPWQGPVWRQRLLHQQLRGSEAGLRSSGPPRGAAFAVNVGFASWGAITGSCTAAAALPGLAVAGRASSCGIARPRDSPDGNQRA